MFNTHISALKLTKLIKTLILLKTVYSLIPRNLVIV